LGKTHLALAQAVAKTRSQRNVMVLTSILLAGASAASLGAGNLASSQAATNAMGVELNRHDSEVAAIAANASAVSDEQTHYSFEWEGKRTELVARNLTDLRAQTTRLYVEFLSPQPVAASASTPTPPVKRARSKKVPVTSASR
jgi:hypothetical protein